VIRLLFLSIPFLVLLAAADEPPTSLVSPDGKWRIERRHEEAGKDPATEQGTDDLYLVPAGTADANEKTIVARADTLKSMLWSPDSSFLVMTFESGPNRENPREFLALVLCLDDRRLRDLNGYFPDGFVAGPAIAFEGEDSVVLSIELYGTDPDGYLKTTNPPGETLPMHVDLKEAAPFLMPFSDEDDPAEATKKVSPDGSLRAVVRVTCDPERPEHEDDDSFHLYVFSQETGEMRCSIDCPSRRRVDRMQWSPDSRFLVLTTSSCGGHSPVNENTYVYCREDESLRTLSHYRPRSRVTSPEIGFAGDNIALLEVDEGRCYTIAVPLARDAPAMPPVRQDNSRGDTPSIFTCSSPDQKWFAAARPVPDRSFPWKQDLDSFRLIIRTSAMTTPGDEGKEVLRYDGLRQRVLEMEWSRNSAWLAFTTCNTDRDGPASRVAWLWNAEDGGLRNLSSLVQDESLEEGGIWFTNNDSVNISVSSRGDWPRSLELPLKEVLAKVPKVKLENEGK
jgi:hypothetical protein